MYHANQQKDTQTAPKDLDSLINFVQVVHNPSMKQVDSAVIWLHGLGANGHDFAPIVPELHLPVSLSTRFIFPHAPSMPVTVNNGTVMPAWYDILELSLERKFNKTHLDESVENIRALMDALIADGIPSERIIVAGFSQGGAVAYETALASPYELAGLLSLSTYLATKDTIDLSTANSHLPIFIGHGTRDEVVPEELGKQAHQFLIDKEYPVIYKSYDIEHCVLGQEIADISNWITERLTR